MFTKRQLRAAALVLGGMSGKEAADAMGIREAAHSRLIGRACREDGTLADMVKKARTFWGRCRRAGLAVGAQEVRPAGAVSP